MWNERRERPRASSSTRSCVCANNSRTAKLRARFVGVAGMLCVSYRVSYCAAKSTARQQILDKMSTQKAID